jgi:hypothetical protein
MPRVEIVDLGGITSGWAPGAPIAVTASLCQSVVPIAAAPEPSAGLNGSNATAPVPDEERWRCHVYTPPEVTLRKIGCTPEPVEPPRLLAGGFARPAAGGVASFSDLRVDAEGRYLLRFSSGGLARADSAPFEVRRGAAHRLAVVRAVGGATPGLPFRVQPAVAVQDVGGKTVRPPPPPSY